MAEERAPETDVAEKPEPQQLASMVPTESPLSAALMDKEAFERGWRVAQMFARSDLVPEQFRGHPENCLVSMYAAHCMRVPALMLMQGTYFVHNKMGLEGKMMIALVNKNGPFDGPLSFDLHGEGDSRACTCWATHPATGERCEATVSYAMAKASGWTKSNPNWQNITDQMLIYRAGTFFARRYAPETILGLQSVDELKDVGPDKPAFDITKPGMHQFGKQKRIDAEDVTLSPRAEININPSDPRKYTVTDAASGAETGQQDGPEPESRAEPEDPTVGTPASRADAPGAAPSRDDALAALKKVREKMGLTKQQVNERGRGLGYETPISKMSAETILELADQLEASWVQPDEEPF